MNNLPIIDIAVIICYLLAMLWIGFYFSKKNRNSERFTTAAGKIPGWAIGVSIFATFLSSNTFLGVTGKAYGSNWNSFVFSLSMPLAAWAAVKYFVPFYRHGSNVSAYTHLENRFGPWARTYAVICFLLTQVARMGSIFFGIALSLQALTGFSMGYIMVVMGVCIIIYTVLGGMEAIIWTDVVQGLILTFGALLILFFIVKEMPGGAEAITEIGKANKKFSLGSFNLDFASSSFWVILLYGFFINLNNFGMDQNYIQRYHTAASEKKAAKSVWLSVYLYVPISMLFFIMGAALFAYYSVHPEMIAAVKMQAAAEQLGNNAANGHLQAIVSQMSAGDYGDKVLPHFMVSRIPAGLVGLVIAAILSAAMSTISSCMNASATVFSIDIYQKYFKKNLTDKGKMKSLYVGTVFFGAIGLFAGLAMIGSKSILDVWWELSGIFAGGMLGLFLLGFISRKVRNAEAVIAVIIGLVIILWMTFSDRIGDDYSWLKSTLHKNMIIVVGTLSIFLSGLMLSSFRKKTC